jgi:23S rRNA (adenine2503-C2)-methyltransferase
VESIFDLSPEALTAWLRRHDVPGYRARQVRRWLFERPPDDFQRMTDLPGLLRTRLAEEFRLWTTRVVRTRQAKDGTRKLLLELDDGQQIEGVLLRDEKEHRTICISTQVGCAMGCTFCASGLEGVVRNLTSGEIVEQMLQLKRLLDQGERLSHVVVMGMGEPLANLDRLLPALAIASGADGLGISARRITISTVGLPAAIRRLADADHQYHLAVSLHAPDDELRNRLVPANRKVGIQAILAAADDYFQRTHRRVTYEYVLLAGINDQREHADRLVGLLQGRPALVNVIPYNPVDGLPYRTPRAEVTARFAETLRTGGLNVQVRHRKGERIDAACGQLRRAEG